MDGNIRKRASRIALALGLGILCTGPAPDISAQQRQQEVAPCRVQRGDRHVREEGDVAVGLTTLEACAQAIWAGSGTGIWGPNEVEVDAYGRVRVNGEEIGALHSPPDGTPAEGDGPGRG